MQRDLRDIKRKKVAEARYNKQREKQSLGRGSVKGKNLYQLQQALRETSTNQVKAKLGEGKTHPLWTLKDRSSK